MWGWFNFTVMSFCFFATKELWVIDNIIRLCKEFKIELQYGFYLTDHWALLYDDLDIAFVRFNIVRKHWPCSIYPF